MSVSIASTPSVCARLGWAEWVGKSVRSQRAASTAPDAAAWYEYSRGGDADRGCDDGRDDDSCDDDGRVGRWPPPDAGERPRAGEERRLARAAWASPSR